MSTITCKVKITKKVFNNGDFFIFGAMPYTPIPKELKLNKYGNITIKGNVGFLVENKDYEVEIEEAETTQYRTSYNVISLPSAETIDLSKLSRSESYEILCDITTGSQAKNLLDAYEDFIWRAVEAVDTIDTKNIYNVGEFRLNAYVRELKTRYKYLGIMNKLKDWKCDVKDCQKLLDSYGEYTKIAKAIDENPYHVLCNKLKRSFETADKLIIANKPELAHTQTRCEYLILSIIAIAELEGDTKIMASDIYDYAISEYPLARELEDLIVPTITNSEVIYYNEEDRTCASMETYIAEKTIADFFIDKYNNSTKLDLPWENYKECRDGLLTEEQSNILKTFCESNVTIVDSIGGTGKSATTMALLNMLDDAHMTYTLLSPTGRVCKVLKELTHRPASTIHRAYFANQKDGIHSDVFILEEGGMISDELMMMFIQTIGNPDARIVVNLDLGQIAPLSCGCPMRDLIKSEKLPVCKLTKVFRYGDGGLSKMATDAYAQKFYLPDGWESKDRISVGKDNDYTFVKYDGTLEQVVGEYQRFLKKGYKPEDIAIITPWNVTELGTININNEVQALVNPVKYGDKYIEKTIRKINVKFKVGDLILNCKNNYNVLTYDGYLAMKSDSKLKVDDVPKTSCMNGEIGKIVSIDEKNIIAKFDEQLIVIDTLMQNNILLAYSLTSFKLQGSSVPYVISLVTPEFAKSLNKNIIYTDLSRTKKEIVEIVDPAILAESIAIDATMNRKTNMQEIINKKFHEEG